MAGQTCSHCGRRIDGLPFICRYCGRTFCAACHLPPQHNCPGEHLWRARPPPGISIRYSASSYSSVHVPAAREPPAQPQPPEAPSAPAATEPPPERRKATRTRSSSRAGRPEPQPPRTPIQPNPLDASITVGTLTALITLAASLAPPHATALLAPAAGILSALALGAAAGITAAITMILITLLPFEGDLLVSTAAGILTAIATYKSTRPH